MRSSTNGQLLVVATSIMALLPLLSTNSQTPDPRMWLKHQTDMTFERDPATAQSIITTTPSGVSVAVDSAGHRWETRVSIAINGEDMGETPWRGTLPPGHHRIDITYRRESVRHEKRYGSYTNWSESYVRGDYYFPLQLHAIFQCNECGIDDIHDYEVAREYHAIRARFGEDYAAAHEATRDLVLDKRVGCSSCLGPVDQFITSRLARPFGSRASSGLPGLGNIGSLPGPSNLFEALAGLSIPAVIAVLGAILNGLMGGGFGAAPVTAPPAPERSMQDKVDDPHPLDRIVDVDGKEWIYYKPVGDEATQPFWVDVSVYEKDQHHLAQGDVWFNGGWSSREMADYQRTSQERFRADVERQGREMAIQYQEQLNRQSENRRALEILQELQDRAVRHGMADIGAKDDVFGRIGEEIVRIHSGERPDADTIARAHRIIRNQLQSNQVDLQHEMDLAKRSAHRWDVATRTAEAVQSAADKSIDILAKCTGPKGKKLQRLYRAASNVAGGVSEGYATGDYSRSLVEAGARIVDGEIRDVMGKAKPKTKLYYAMGSGAIKGGFQGAMDAEKKDGWWGAAALGALEGGAAGANRFVQNTDTFKELGAPAKVIYKVYEGAFHAGYENVKAGGSLEDVRRTMERGVVAGAAEGVVDFTLSSVGGLLVDQIIPPPNKALTEKELFATIKDICSTIGNAEQAKNLISLVNLDWREDYLAEEFTNWAREICTAEYAATSKGKGLFSRFQDIVNLV